MATPLTYRQWLQLKADDSTPENAWDANSAGMLLQVVGDDGRLDANAVGSNRSIVGSDGVTYKTAGTSGDLAAPARGLMDVNDALLARYNNYRNNPELVAQYNQGDGGGGSGSSDPYAAERAGLKNRIKSRAGDIDAAYGSLFGELDTLIGSRDAELETQYGGQLQKAANQYAEALPAIDQSFAALGSYDSTQRGDSRGKAKKGFEETTTTIGANKKKDKDALGQYANEQRAKFTADRDSAKRFIESADATTDVGALRSAANELDTNLSQTGVTKASLGTNGAKTVSDLTSDAGRYEAAVNALDSILKSSMASDVKAAAVKAVTDSAGLSDDEKKKVQQTYGNVYAEQAAL